MIGAIVLAAGSSTRMGTQKLVLPFAGVPLIQHVVDSVLEGGVSEVVVVTGHSRAAVETALAGTKVHCVHNADYAEGMLSSVRAGIRALREGVAPMVVLGDQPFIPRTLLPGLAETVATRPDAIAVPVYHGRRGHPIAFAACYRREVLTEFDDVGLRGLLRKHAEAVVEIDVESEGILDDVDTPVDYENALKKLRERSNDIRT